MKKETRKILLAAFVGAAVLSFFYVGQPDLSALAARPPDPGNSNGNGNNNGNNNEPITCTPPTVLRDGMCQVPDPDPNVQKVDTGIVVALYIYPNSDWDKLAQIQTRHPTVPTIALVNPSNGPGNAINSDFTRGIQTLESAGITACGYVPTWYARAPQPSPYTNIVYDIPTIQRYIDNWVTWYGVDCIFFDEMANWAGPENFYHAIDNYAKSKGITYTIGNPGADSATRRLDEQ